MSSLQKEQDRKMNTERKEYILNALRRAMLFQSFDEILQQFMEKYSAPINISSTGEVFIVTYTDPDLYAEIKHTKSIEIALRGLVLRVVQLDMDRKQ